MSTNAGDIFVKVRTDMNGFNRGMKQIDSGLGRAGQAFRTFGKVALGAAAVVAGGFVVAMKRGFDELGESQRVMAQTEAVLKSTGGIANVTADHVDKLSTTLSRMSGVDDELIAKGENWLLTFKNIRNEMGAGNDIFDQATKATLDLAVAQANAKGTAVDLAGASNMMGKALNDPVKGMTALGKAGVTFDDAQNKMIKSLVASGDLMGAQKVILAELAGQVGGSAKAYGETFPQQLAKLRNAFDEEMGKVAKVIVPTLVTALQGVGSFMDDLSEAKGFKAKMSVVGDAIGDIAGRVKSALGKVDWGKVWDEVKITGQGLVDKIHKALDNADWGRITRGVADALVKGLEFSGKLANKITEELVQAASEVDWGTIGKEFAKKSPDLLKNLFLVGPGFLPVLADTVVKVARVLDPDTSPPLKKLVEKYRTHPQWLSLQFINNGECEDDRGHLQNDATGTPIFHENFPFSKDTQKITEMKI